MTPVLTTTGRTFPQCRLTRRGESEGLLERLFNVVTLTQPFSISALMWVRSLRIAGPLRSDDSRGGEARQFPVRGASPLLFGYIVAPSEKSPLPPLC